MMPSFKTRTEKLVVLAVFRDSDDSYHTQTLSESYIDPTGVNTLRLPVLDELYKALPTPDRFTYGRSFRPTGSIACILGYDWFWFRDVTNSVPCQYHERKALVNELFRLRSQPSDNRVPASEIADLKPMLLVVIPGLGFYRELKLVELLLGRLDLDSRKSWYTLYDRDLYKPYTLKPTPLQEDKHYAHIPTYREYLQRQGRKSHTHVPKLDTYYQDALRPQEIRSSVTVTEWSKEYPVRRLNRLRKVLSRKSDESGSVAKNGRRSSSGWKHSRKCRKQWGGL